MWGCGNIKPYMRGDLLGKERTDCLPARTEGHLDSGVPGTGT